MGAAAVFASFFIFVIGLCVGSFLNVVVMRTLAGEAFVTGRSRCDHCRRVLAWYELIPLFSFVVLRGRCRTCQREIDIMHPVVELITGALFLWWWLIGFAFFRLTEAPLTIIQPLFWLSIGVVLLTTAVIDVRAMIIPDWSTVGIFLSTLLYRMIVFSAGIYRAEDAAAAMFGAALMLSLFLALWLITRGRGMGFGDVKLVFSLAFLVGWPNSIVMVFLAFVLGALVGMLLLVAGKARWKQPLPFGPFLVAGSVLTLLWGTDLLRWYLSLL